MPRKREVVLRKIVHVAVIVACGALPAARASDPPATTCAYHEEPAPAPGASVDVGKHRVTLLAVSPKEGAEVRADSVIEIDVEYHVANFLPDKFYLVVQFPTVSLNWASPGTGDWPKLQSPSGKVHLCVPLKEMYESRSVRWPLSLVVRLLEQFPEYSQLKTESRSVPLNSVDVPAGALKRQAEAMPEDVQRALMSLFGFVEQKGAMHKICSERFADLQAGFIKTFRAWETRNAVYIRQIQEMQYAAYLESFGNAAVAAQVFDMNRAATVKFLNELKEPELRKHCEGGMEALSDETSDVPTASAVNFEIVQKYLAAKAKPEATK
jgi:hypothetical protein